MMRKAVRYLLLFSSLLFYSCAMRNQQVRYIVINGDLARLQEWKAQGGDFKYRDHDYYTLLHIAADKGYTPIVKYLLTNGLSPDARGRYGETPLHLACYAQKTEVVRELIAADKRAVNLVDANGISALHIACGNGNMEIVRLLVSNQADMLQCDRDKRYPIHWAAYEGHENIVRYLLETEPKNMEVKDELGMSPLHWAANRGKDEVVAYLARTDMLNALDSNGRNALHWAAEGENFSTMRILIDNGLRLDAKDHDGKTPLSFLSFSQRQEIENYAATRRGK